MTSPTTALYVHVPFCVAKCAYCDFASRTPRVPSELSSYVNAALTETTAWSDRGVLGDVSTLYFGGGTPTLLGDGLVSLLAGILERCGLRADAEITVETNPETTTPEIVSALRDAGVTRMSLGVQSFDDDVLQTLGRRHDAATAQSVARLLAGSGMSAALDLICGVPGQSMESWDASLRRAIDTGAGHVSVYPLSVEEGTPLCGSVDAGCVPEPDPDLAADMMLHAAKVLSAAGMVRYETASHARPGQESRHNTAYWTGVPYIGIGPGAHSMLPAGEFDRIARAEGWYDHPWNLVPGTSEAARVRFSVAEKIEDYLAASLRPPLVAVILTASEVAAEDVMLGLRMVEGVDVALVDNAGLTGVLAELQADGLVERAGERWRTTERGWLLGNEVFGRVLEAG
ncbi:MAG: radical SAM family heme chaperone HemW [Coriobacteriia bacterium]|nr:radical SAM family heme chaperone HemW [Coriobacteriia bacterium]